jgi:hypothetical protein
MNGFLTVAIAHDATCEPGEEWVFHGLAQPHDAFGDGKSTIDTKDNNLLDKDMDELRKHYAKKDETNNDRHAKWGCALVIVAAFIYLLCLPIGISYLIERLMP